MLSRLEAVKVSNSDQEFRILTPCGGVMHCRMVVAPFVLLINEEINDGVVKYVA
jgi:hypothetical protein